MRLRAGSRIEKHCNLISTSMARRHFSSHMPLAVSADDNYNDEGGAPPNNNWHDRKSPAAPTRRRVDDYDSLFFQPARPKPPGDSPSSSYEDGGSSYSRHDDEHEESTYNGDHGEGENDGEGTGKYNTSAPRPQAASPRPQASSSPGLYRQHEQSQSFKISKTQPQRQQIQEETTPAFMSTRALYQFRPLPPGSSRPMPPTISGYDSIEYNDDDQENADEDVTTNTDNFFDMDQDADSIAESEPVKAMERIIPEEKQSEPSSTIEATELPSSSGDAKIASPLLSEEAAATPKLASSAPPTYPKPFARITPSFMEPEKTKAMINVNESDDPQRKLPVEASSGNSSTSHLTSLSHQLEHLTAQIYQRNDGVQFNINSPKQVADVLFGDDDNGDRSTNKDVLEAMASAGNEMA